MTTATPVEAPELEHLDHDLDPVCEITEDCPEHGEERCDLPARWVGRWTCTHGREGQILVCDLHKVGLTKDGFISKEGPQTIASWTAL